MGAAVPQISETQALSDFPLHRLQAVTVSSKLAFQPSHPASRNSGEGIQVEQMWSGDCTNLKGRVGSGSRHRKVRVLLIRDRGENECSVGDQQSVLHLVSDCESLRARAQVADLGFHPGISPLLSVNLERGYWETRGKLEQ